MKGTEYLAEKTFAGRPFAGRQMVKGSATLSHKEGTSLREGCNAAGAPKGQEAICSSREVMLPDGAAAQIIS